MKLAPVVLFVYNRPEHTLKTLKALRDNRLSDQTSLYVFSDGPKNDDDQAVSRVNNVRQTLKSERWCKEVKIIERENNIGLAENIITGINEIFKFHTKLIVLEDDIVTSSGFLTFMNFALEKYENNQVVKHISGFIPPIGNHFKSTFFTKASFCWGWGTWKRAWNEFEKNTGVLIKKFQTVEEIKDFNLDNSHDFYKQLIQNFEAKIDTWAIKWYATIFHQNGLCLNPQISLCRNIGNDNSGVHSIKSTTFDWEKLGEQIEISDIDIKESKKARTLLKKFYRHSTKSSFPQWFKQRLSQTLSSKIKMKFKSILSKEMRKRLKEIERLNQYPRFQEVTTDLVGFPLKLNDSKSFLFNYQEIFQSEVYRFNSKEEKPMIIDGGVNIGLSIIYFRRLFPQSQIIGFEADKDIYQIAQDNINQSGLNKGVKIYCGALWKTTGSVNFNNSGADSGRIEETGSLDTKTYQLSGFLDKKIDFLKLDIEGAEYEVLKESEDYLKNVERIFIEYHSFKNKDQKLDEILRILKKNSFRYYISTPGLFQSNPLIEVNTYMQMDMQINIYALRE